MGSLDPTRVVALDTIGKTKAYIPDGVFPAIATDIQIDARMAQECVLTASITLLGNTVSAAKRVTMGMPSRDPVVSARVLIQTVLPPAASCLVEMCNAPANPDTQEHSVKGVHQDILGIPRNLEVAANHAVVTAMASWAVVTP